MQSGSNHVRNDTPTPLNNIQKKWYTRTPQTSDNNNNAQSSNIQSSNIQSSNIQSSNIQSSNNSGTDNSILLSVHNQQQSRSTPHLEPINSGSVHSASNSGSNLHAHSGAYAHGKSMQKKSNRRISYAQDLQKMSYIPDDGDDESDTSSMFSGRTANTSRTANTTTRKSVTSSKGPMTPLQRRPMKYTKSANQLVNKDPSPKPQAQSATASPAPVAVSRIRSNTMKKLSSKSERANNRSKSPKKVSINPMSKSNSSASGRENIPTYFQRHSFSAQQRSRPQRSGSVTTFSSNRKLKDRTGAFNQSSSNLKALKNVVLSSSLPKKMSIAYAKTPVPMSAHHNASTIGHDSASPDDGSNKYQRRNVTHKRRSLYLPKRDTNAMRATQNALRSKSPNFEPNVPSEFPNTLNLNDK